MAFENLAIGARKLSNPKFIEGLIIKSLKPYEAEIIDLNTSQLAIGKLSTGADTDTYASDEYAASKQALGSKSGGRMDFKLTGDFYGDFKVDFKDDSFIIDSDDDKANDLEGRYGSDIFGLTDENLGEVGELIVDDLVDEIVNTLLG